MPGSFSSPIHVTVNVTGAEKAPANGSYRIVDTVNGTFLQLWNPTLSKWHTVFLNGSSTNPTLSIGPAES